MFFLNRLVGGVPGAQFRSPLTHSDRRGWRFHVLFRVIKSVKKHGSYRSFSSEKVLSIAGLSHYANDQF